MTPPHLKFYTFHFILHINFFFALIFPCYNSSSGWNGCRLIALSFTVDLYCAWWLSRLRLQRPSGRENTVNWLCLWCVATGMISRCFTPAHVLPPQFTTYQAPPQFIAAATHALAALGTTQRVSCLSQLPQTPAFSL